MTPTDLMAARKMGADFVKIYPCGPLGYTGPPLWASDRSWINPEGLPLMKEEQVRELARRYLKIVKTA